MQKLKTLMWVLIGLTSFSCATVRVDADIPPKPYLEMIPDYSWFTPQNEREELLLKVIETFNLDLLLMLEWGEKVIVNNKQGNR